ncbi:protein kinase family protein [Streptomyces massasporeus]|uniref:protein kinase family protein n=1 Tax=Streptomyces massasporeus TaxID=67324 RepID=UPI003405EEB5
MREIPPAGTAPGRLSDYDTVATSLALLGDTELRELLDSAVPLSAGIGGTSARLDVSGTPVFVKRVPLTDLEQRPEHRRSTANLFGLPMICQYGIGGPSFGAWREVAAHAMTTNWVLSGQFQGVPLMYHWRVLPDEAPHRAEELADVEKVVAYWGGSAGVRRRVEALHEGSASVALFLEYVPHTLHTWLTARARAGGEALDRACSLVEKELAAGTSFMNSRGLLHFDAHFENILTDGRRLYFADFGLALSTRFALTPTEADFYDRHRAYDRCYTASWFVNWLISALYGEDWETRGELIRAWAQGKGPAGAPPGTAEILTRNAPVAAVMTDFYRTLQRESRTTPYPGERLQHLCP